MITITFEEAEALSKICDYAWAAVQPEGNEINFADAAGFFLEGYEHCIRINGEVFSLTKKQRDTAWEEDRKIREKISAAPGESTYDEVVSLINRYTELEKQNRDFLDKLELLIVATEEPPLIQE